MEAPAFLDFTELARPVEAVSILCPGSPQHLQRHGAEARQNLARFMPSAADGASSAAAGPASCAIRFSTPTTRSSVARPRSSAAGRFAEGLGFGVDAWSHLELQAHRCEYSKNSGKVRKLFVAESAIDA